MDKSIIINSIFYTLVIVIALPVIGILIDMIVSGVLKGLFRIIDRSGSAYYIFVNFLTIPGVMLHEISHAGFAFITGAKIVDMKLYEFSNGHLGYVSYVPRGLLIFKSIQLSLASSAPVITGLVASPFLLRTILYADISKGARALLSYLLVCVLCHMDMSGADLKGYIKGLPCCTILIFCIVCFLQIKGILVI